MGLFGSRDLVDETFTLRRGREGSLVVNLRTGSVARRVEKLTIEAREEIAASIARDAASNAPRGTEPLRRGRRQRLHQSITSGRTRSEPENAFVRAGFPAAFQEFGTRHHAAQVFMRPALESNIPRMKAAIEQRGL